MTVEERLARLERAIEEVSGAAATWNSSACAEIVDQVQKIKAVEAGERRREELERELDKIRSAA